MNYYTMFAQASAPAATASAAPAQTTATTTQAQPTPDAAKPQAAQQSGGGLGMFLPMLLIFGLFYFMMIRPQQRKEKERRKMISELRAGAKIVFAGGLMGTIKEARETTFLVEISNGVNIEIARACVQDVAPEAAPAK